MGFLRKLLGFASSEPDDEPSLDGADTEEEGVSYKELLRQLVLGEEQTRHDTAMLLSALGHRGAIRPLIKSYALYGDEALLDALRAFGPRVTMVAAREAREPTISAVQRARLMDVLAVSDDPGAVTLVLPFAEDQDPRVRTAACGALARLGDPRGIDMLADDLLRLDAELRALALRQLTDLSSAEAEAAIEEYVAKYLSAAGAVPDRIEVSLPLFVNREQDLVDLLGERLSLSSHKLTVVTGPAMDTIAEQHREELQRLLPGLSLYFVTPRHSHEEQMAALREARAECQVAPEAKAAVVGRLPSPEGAHPVGHFLTRSDKAEYTAGIILVGPLRFALVGEWWRYVADRAEVPTDLAVVLTNLVLGGGDMSTEEMAIYQLAGEERRAEFARALLAQL